MTQLRRAVHRLATDHLGLQSGETVAIVAGGEVGELDELAWETALQLRARPLAVRLPPLRRRRNGLPAALLALLKETDAFLVFLPDTLSEQEIGALSTGRCRGLQVASIDRAALFRVLSASSQSVADRSRRVADVFSIGKNLEVHTPSGTQITLSVARVKGRAETGIAKQRCEFARVPAGNASVVPVRRTTEGVIVTDRICGRRAPLKQPVRIYLKGGVITQIKGGPAAQPVRNMLRQLGRGKRRVVRLSFGTNHGAELGHSDLEDEVVMGVLHISLGADAVGQKQGPEVRLVLTQSTLTIDKHPIVQEGRIVV